MTRDFFAPGPPPDFSCILVYLSQSIETAFIGGVTCIFQRVCDVVSSDLYLAYPAPQRDLDKLYCTFGVESISTRIVFTRLFCI